MAGGWVWACLVPPRSPPLLKITVENTCYPCSLAGPRPIPLVWIMAHFYTLKSPKNNFKKLSTVSQASLLQLQWLYLTGPSPGGSATTYYRFDHFFCDILTCVWTICGCIQYWGCTGCERRKRHIWNVLVLSTVKEWSRAGSKHIPASSLTRNHTHIQTWSKQGARWCICDLVWHILANISSASNRHRVKDWVLKYLYNFCLKLKHRLRSCLLPDDQTLMSNFWMEK